MHLFCSKRRNGQLTTLLGLTLSVLLFSALASASTLVDPSRFIFTVKPGTKATGTIKVTNPGNKEAQVKAVVYDWTLNEVDKMVTSELGSRKDSLRGLIKFNPQSFKLAPGDSQIVRFTLSAPADAALFERRGIVFFEEKTLSDLQKTGASVITQVGSTIYLGIEGMKMAFNIDNIAVVHHGQTNAAELTAINNGCGHVRYSLSYKIINEKGALLKEDNLSEQVILPETKRKLTFPLTAKLDSGKYNLQLTVHFFGTNQTVVRTLPFTVQ